MTALVNVLSCNFSACIGCLQPFKLLPLRNPLTSIKGAKGGGEEDEVVELEVGDIDESR